MILFTVSFAPKQIIGCTVNIVLYDVALCQTTFPFIFFFHLLLYVSFYRQLKAAYSFAFFKTIKMISGRMFYYLTKNCFIFIL